MNEWVTGVGGNDGSSSDDGKAWQKCTTVRVDSEVERTVDAAVLP